MQTIDALLRESPTFTCLDDDELAVIAGCASNVQFKAGEVIFREGDAANTFLLVRHGSVALETFLPASGPMTIETVGAGEVVGWSWLFAPYRWQFDARALTDVRATSFDGACLRMKCEEDPVLGYDVMQCFARVMIERLQWTRLRLLDVYGNVGAR
jgi:CRP/FNR family transcriptional regulator, cyclic AMP receptor protein